MWVLTGDAARPPTAYFDVSIDDFVSERAVHAAALRNGILHEARQALMQFSRLAYEIHMLDPEVPSRRSYRGGHDLPVWREWHRVRNLDPYLRRGYSLPRKLRALIIARDGHVCGLCGGDVEPADIHIDHVKPRKLGGTDEPSNLQVAHSFCNISKGARAWSSA